MSWLDSSFVLAFHDLEVCTVSKTRPFSMSFTRTSQVTACSERDFSNFSNLTLKPLLEYISVECITAFPSSGLGAIDFVIKQLTENKKHLDELCRSYGVKAKPHKSSMSEEKASAVTRFEKAAGDEGEMAQSDLVIKDSDSLLKCKVAVSKGFKRRDARHLHQIFVQNTDASGFLPSCKLTKALSDAGAAIIPESAEAAALAITRIDIDGDLVCDFGEFMRMVNEQDDLALFFREKQLPALADALRVLVGCGSDQLLRVSQLSDADIQTAVAAVCSCLPDRAMLMRQELQVSFQVQSDLFSDSPNSDSKFGMAKMACGSIDDFHKGLTGRIGAPHLDFKREMMREHCVRYGCNTQFTTSNYGIITTPKREWSYIAGSDTDNDGIFKEGIPCPDEHMHFGRRITSINELMLLPLVKQADLKDFEVLALVLYTGPMYVVYNAILRQHPAAMYQQFNDGGNTFPTTIFVLVSAVTKVTKRTRIPEGTLLYRGLGGRIDLPDHFFSLDSNGTSGYADWGFMSTTANLETALGYSGLKQKRAKAMIMVIETMSVDKGADISMFSQYPGEKEFLWAPCSFVQRALGVGSRMEVVDGGLVTFVPVKVNLNLRMETVEELQEKKKLAHIVSARAIVDDLQFELHDWATSASAAERLLMDTMHNQDGKFSAASLAATIIKQCTFVVNRHNQMPIEEYVDDGTFRMLVSEILDMKSWAKEKIMLWERDHSQYLCYLQDWSLRDCHRMWQAFLRQIISSTIGVPSEASSKLLTSRGLAKQSAHGLSAMNADGEDLLVQAGADGWAAADITAAVAAGADVSATNALGCNGAWNAARYGHALSLNAMIASRVDPRVCNSNGASPLFIAALNGHRDCIALLLLSNCDVNECHSNGSSPLYVAAQNGHSDLIAPLVSSKADVDICNNEGASPVFIAASNGHSECIQQLMAFSADVNKCKNDGMHPLVSAASNGHVACVSQLLSACFDSLDVLAAALEHSRKCQHDDCIRVLEAAISS
jgi:ankyrin repeat protein